MGGRFSSATATPQVLDSTHPSSPLRLPPAGTNREHMVGAVGGMYRREPPRASAGLSLASSSTAATGGRLTRNGIPGMCAVNPAAGLAIGGLSLGSASGSNGVSSGGSLSYRASTPGAANDASQVRSIIASALPMHLFSYRDIKCPICSRLIPPDDFECHLVMCLTRPRISYNEEVLTEDKDECIICLDEMLCGETIARLPCLCIYHKSCIDNWFQVNRSCPEHPGD